MAMRLCVVWIAVLCAIVSRAEAQNWQGHLATYSEQVVSTCWRCLCQYSWGCSAWRDYSCTVWVTKQRCADGYEHNGTYICNIPICSPRCLNGGTCIEPNRCRCNGLAIGPFCGTEICSRDRPCYPGDCYENSNCNCTEGFDKTTTVPSPADPGCMKISSNNKPFIGRSTTIISNFRNTRELLLYYFLLDATDEDPQKRVVWSNQQVFNYLSFEFEARYVEPQTMPARPTYVHDFKYGIVGGKVDVKVFDFNKVSAGHRGAYNFTCPVISVLYPKQLMNCSLPDNPFKTLIEHGDTMEVTLTAYSGGHRKILFPDGNIRTENITGTEYTKQLEFKFDFEPAVHCSSKNSTFTCQSNTNVLKATSEFTKTPIVLQWKGWVDTDKYSAGVGAYRLELHRLEVKDATLELTEANPTLPLLENRVNHTGNTTVQNLFSTTFTPPEPGMYSIVMEVTDNANNSIFTRRFALYDNVSSVTTNPLSVHGLHATSAAPETGYRWQTETKSIKLDWKDYFVNKVHHEKKFLNKIKKFPTLFDDLELIGIRNVKKFVFDSYDDTEGLRTMDAIPNVNGITRFQYGYVVNQSSAQAPTAWNNISSSTQNIDVAVSTSNGDTVTLWVRAFDILDNMLEKKTTVNIDATPPLIVTSPAENKTSTFTPNAGQAEGGYYYSSYEFYARDEESGVYQIDLDVSITMADIGEVRRFRQVVNGSIDKTKKPSDPACVPSKDPDTCFLERQKVRLENCWFLVPKKDYIINAGATVSVSVFNQARQAVNTNFQIKQLNTLKGLEVYSGPENIRITNTRPDSFRIQWDLPTVKACYDSLPIIIYVAFSDDTQPKVYYLTSTTTFLDVAGLTPNTVYKISFYAQLSSINKTDITEAFAQKSVKTEKPDEPGLSAGVVAGVAIGVIAFVIICIIVMVVLVRMGVIKNPEPVARVTRAVTRRYRQSRYGPGADSAQPPHRPPKGVENPSYSSNEKQIKLYDNNRPMSEDIYLPGGADVNVINVPLLRRSDITLDSKITTGRFAYIYKATLERGKSRETVVAKTLKENFNDNDRNLMNTKINFLGNYVGNHPNILKFIAAVTDDHMIGPFIVHEHCENGTLKDYLAKQQGNVTIQLQDNLFRFGLDVAKGMEYLASKSVVHRRLAARNVLLNFLYEVKITGFGPQPAHNEEGGVAEEEENIPIKWVAPECMKSTRDATERSDVWSYAVTLWEIFSLGQTPYGKIQSRDVPTRIKKGLRLEKPEQCDDTWYAVMTRCWSYEANRRPSFEEIREELDNLFAPRDGEMDTYYYTRR
ncbi:uncharacterized protein LOC127839217 isoform X2 [Dreissena polymorpha]|uniref:uncharacterized protein LOC127839217 isoform X2 n=1 Tax=Dreissena polymorpha TaxID=45954 RepID=UPI0022656B82|nr:uncharacterized protein LOC127839217 isoform X2 [Dreissena polymorpha]